MIDWSNDEEVVRAALNIEGPMDMGLGEVRKCNQLVIAYVAAHRTQEAKPCYCQPGDCDIEGGYGLLDGFTCKQSGTQEAPAEAQEDHIAHSHEMVTQPTHSAAELPQWVTDLNENSKLDTYHFVGSEVRQLVGEITKGLCALNAANARIAEMEKLLAAHKGISEGKSDVVKQLEAGNG